MLIKLPKTNLLQNGRNPLQGLYGFFSVLRITNTESAEIDPEPAPLSRLDLEFKDKPFELPFHLGENLGSDNSLPFLLRDQKLDIPRRLENDLAPKYPKPVSVEWLEKDDIRLFNLRLFLQTKYDDPEYLQQEMIRVYRKLLRESLKFIDERARIFLIQEIQRGFRKFQHFPVTDLVNSKRDEARVMARKLARANRYEMKDFLSILEQVYGRSFKVKKALLEPYLPPKILFSETFKPGFKNEISLHPMLLALIQFYGLSLKPGNILGAQHSNTRLFNLYRRHYRKLTHEKIFPPLPAHIVQELEARCDTQYHVYHAMHYPLDPNPSTKKIIGRVDKRVGVPPRVPAPPDFARLRSVARCYQKLMLQVPLQTSGPGYYTFQRNLQDDSIKFALSKWAGSRRIAQLQDFDLLHPGEAGKYLLRHSAPTEL